MAYLPGAAILRVKAGGLQQLSFQPHCHCHGVDGGARGHGGHGGHGAANARTAPTPRSAPAAGPRCHGARRCRAVTRVHIRAGPRGRLQRGNGFFGGVSRRHPYDGDGDGSNSTPTLLIPSDSRSATYAGPGRRRRSALQCVQTGTAMDVAARESSRALSGLRSLFRLPRTSSSVTVNPNLT